MSGFLYSGYANLKRNPEIFSMENTNKALWKMGTHAQALIAVVYLLMQKVGSGNH